MKILIILYCLFNVIVINGQVIPVGFMKGFTNKPTGENPVSSNLLFYLDATRTASYDGTGTTWTDIKVGGTPNSASLTNSPTFGSGSMSNGSGSFTFSGNNYALTSNSISSLSTATFIAWINPSQLQDRWTGIIISRSGYAGATAEATGFIFYTNNQIGYIWNNAGATYTWNSTLVVPNNEWSMVALTINSTEANAYLCKSSGITTAKNNVTHGSSNGLKFYIGIEPLTIDTPTLNRGFKGKIATAMVYSTSLTSANISAIFDAQKASFGL